MSQKEERWKHEKKQEEWIHQGGLSFVNSSSLPQFWDERVKHGEEDNSLKVATLSAWLMRARIASFGAKPVPDTRVSV